MNEPSKRELDGMQTIVRVPLALSLLLLSGCGSLDATGGTDSTAIGVPALPATVTESVTPVVDQGTTAPSTAPLQPPPATLPTPPPAPPASMPLVLIEEGCNQCPAGQFCSAGNQCIADGTCLVDDDCPEEGSVCTDGICQAGGECGTEVFDLERVAPNILLLLDRSCSMPDCIKHNLTLAEQCFNLTGVDKWGDSIAVINELTENFRDQIRWGLDLFPDNTGDSCAQDDPIVSLSHGQEDSIQTLLTAALDPTDALFPSGPCVTNILGVLTAADQNPNLRDPTRDNFTILLTDGEEVNCGSAARNHPNSVAAVQNLAADGIDTFVIGFGAGIQPDELNELAVAGNRANPDPTVDYYQADNAAALAVTLADIVSATVGCTMSLNKAPPDLDKLFAFVGQQQLVRDAADGYAYNPGTNQVEFLGAACEAIKQGEQSVQVGFGCPENRPQVAL